jgi:hypothetical protein
VGERDVFKSQINLNGYAAAQGYRIDRKASSHNSVVMRSETGDGEVLWASSPAAPELLPR